MMKNKMAGLNYKLSTSSVAVRSCNNQARQTNNSRWKAIAGFRIFCSRLQLKKCLNFLQAWFGVQILKLIKDGTLIPSPPNYHLWVNTPFLDRLFWNTSL